MDFMKELLKELKPLKIKIYLDIFINCFIIGLAFGLVLCASILIISKFIFVDRLIIKIGIALSIGVLGGVIMSAIRKPNMDKIAVIGDALGFKERFTTAIEILRSDKKDTPMSKLVVKDAVEQAKNTDFKKLYQINISHKKYIALALALTITLVSGFMPVLKADEIKEQAQLQQNIDEELKNIEELKKQPIDAELKNILKELKKDLKTAKSDSEIIKSTQKAQQELKKIENKNMSKDLKELADKLAENELTKSLADKNLASNLNNELEKLKDNKLSKEQLQELADKIDELNKNISEENSLKDLLDNLSKGMKSNNSKQIDSAIENISTKLNQLIQENQELSQSADKISKSLNKAIQNAQQNSNSQSTQQSKPASQSDLAKQSPSDAPQSASNQGQKNSQGQSPSANTKRGSGGSGGSGSIENKDIYTRGLEDVAGTEFNIKGQNNNSGTVQESDTKGDGRAGEIISYDKVYQEYRQEALKGLDENNIPQGMKALVEEYFSSLE